MDSKAELEKRINEVQKACFISNPVALSKAMREPTSPDRDIAKSIMQNITNYIPGETFDDKLLQFHKTAIAVSHMQEAGGGGSEHNNLVILMKSIVPFLGGAAQWANWGYPSFNLTEDFFKVIAISDLGECDGPTNLPFPSFVIHLPASNLFGGCRTLFIHEMPRVAKELEDGTFFMRDLRMDGARMWITEKENAFVVYSDWLKETSVSTAAKHGSDADMPEEDDQRLDLAFRLLGNLLLYINQHGGLPAAGEKKLGADVHIEREHKTLPRFRVGRPIKLAPKLRQVMEMTDHKSAWKLMARFAVRGHWRNQKIGPTTKLEEQCSLKQANLRHTLMQVDEYPATFVCLECGCFRERMFIEPFWKGPEDLTDALQRTYSVE